MHCVSFSHFFFFNDTATTEIYTLSLHDALPISHGRFRPGRGTSLFQNAINRGAHSKRASNCGRERRGDDKRPDRKSTRLNSSHSQISYAVFCLKKKKKTKNEHHTTRQLYVLYSP